MATILVIDDSTPSRLVFSTALQSAGYDVVEASSGHEGLAAYRQRPADLVIVDIMKPTMNGLETIKDLTHEFSNVKVIAVSGMLGEQSLFSTARRLGARQTLRKPFDMDEMLNMVRYELEH
ncbi:MAG: response regulator [Nitrospira sp. BO4]|jgi:two-component system response regulator (stage 0 sporulation protein F)|nr:response regulator [Nitrospira sp. BO4]